MMKRILVVLGYSLFWTAVIFALLVITNRHVLVPLVSFIRKMRGTDGYEGEERGHEGMTIVAAADPTYRWNETEAKRSHVVSKLYYIAWPESTWRAYQAAFRRLVSRVDGIERQAVPWPDWAITTVIDTRSVWSTVWRAVCCHQSQVTAYERLKDLSPEDHEAVWGRQSFYRVFSTVNGGRVPETDLLEGINT